MSTRTFNGEGNPEQLAMFDIAGGEKMEAKADAWIAANGAVWAWMRCKARSYVEEGRHFSISRIVEEARYTKPVEGVDEYRINNDIRAALARRLIKMVPDCSKYIEIRPSKVDLL